MRLGGDEASGFRLEAEDYSLEIDPVEPRARVTPAGGGAPLQLMLLASLSTDSGTDGTLSTTRPTVTQGTDEVAFGISAASPIWDSKALTLRCTEHELRLTATVAGRGRLGELRLLGGPYSGNPRRGTGTFHSRWPARTLFVPAPDDPRRLVQPAAEPATIGVVGGDSPGRGHWFFTPAPFLFAGSEANVETPDDATAAPWTTLELQAPVDRLNFPELRYAPFAGGFSLLLDYEGQTAVDGQFTAPDVVLRFGAPDPYSAVADHAARLRTAGLAPAVERRPAGWWSRPIFCGWGEQFREHRLRGGDAKDYSRRDCYDRWLGVLREHGVVPGTIVIDDRWQSTYGRNEADTERWPDLAGWIAERHAAGQRVLLWFKAWDPEGLPVDACVTDPGGRPITADPESPAYQAILRESLHAMLGNRGLDADGLKVDFTAQTPSGPGLRHAGRAWGVALLHRLLRLVYRFAREAKPDALVVTHTPNPLFADVSDMIRLNDLLRLSEPEPWAPAATQMTHRARIVRAVDADWPIDTDDWCMPDKRQWREYLAVKPALGVPDLYYASGIDLSGEAFDEDDYAAIRAAWGEWQRRQVEAASQ